MRVPWSWHPSRERLPRWLALGLLLLLGWPFRAQGPELRPALRGVGLAEGLPSLTVYAITKDHDQRLWVGTQFGVGRFTGQRFEPVVFPGKLQPSVVRSILRGSGGALWFATDNLGVWRLQEGAWTRFGPAEGLPSNRVNALWEGPLDGGPPQLLAGTNQGLARLVGDRFQPFDPGPGPLSGAWIWRIKTGPEGALWVAARNWIGTRSAGGWKVLTAAQGLPGPDANDLEWRTRPGGGWDLIAAIWNRGVFTFDGTRWSPLDLGQAAASRYPTCLVRSPDLEGPGSILWLGTYDNGIAWFRGGRWRHLNQEKGLPSGGVYALAPDGKPTVWIGTRNAGMVALDLQGWSTLDRSLGLPSNEATALLPTLDDQGRPEVWVGTSKGLAHWQGGRWSLRRLDPTGTDYINCMVETREGARRVLWVGTLRGLARFDGRRWERLDPRTTTRDPQVFSLRPGTAPRGEPVLWAGTQWGLAALRKGAWTFQTRADGLPHDWVLDIAETACSEGERDLWVATRGGGVGRFHRGRWEPSRRGLEAQGDLVVTCLREARGPDGTRWLFAGTQGRGLMRLSLDHPEGPWELFTEENLRGIPAQGISAMALDGRGRLFLGTPKGVLRLTLGPKGHLDPPSVFGRSDGLPSLSIALGSLARGPEGRIWVGTVEGIGVLDAESPDPPPVSAQVLVDWLGPEGRSQPWKDAPTLPYRENRLALRLGLPVYHHFEEVAFRTHLLGLEGAPSPWTVEARRDYPVLPPGRHVLRVWARDHLGREAPPRDLSFQVEAPPWRRSWALAAYLLVAGLGLWGILGFRLRFLTARNRALQDQIRAATEALRSAKEELEDRVRERTRQLDEALHEARAADRAKSAFLARMSHELRTPLNQMLLVTELVREEWAEATGRATSPDLEAIRASGRHLETLISDLLDFSALEAGHLELHPEPFDLHALVSELRSLYGPLARAKGLRLEAFLEPGLPPQMEGDRTRVAQILKDLLSNAIKFTPHGEVVLRCLQAPGEGRLRVEVDDTGPGLAPEAQAKVFGPFEQQDGTLSRRHGGTGLGLAIAKRLVALMEGAIGFEPRPEGGTRFWIEVPFRRVPE